MNPPTEQLPWILDAVKCSECHDEPDKVEACKACRGRGRETLTSCPLAIVTPDVWGALRMCDHAERGAWPAAGGVGDQAAQFVALVEYVRAVDPSENRPENMNAMLLALLKARL